MALSPFFFNFERHIFPYKYNIQLNILEQVDPSLAGLLVSFEAIVVEILARKIPYQRVGFSTPNHFNFPFFGRIFAV